MNDNKPWRITLIPGDGIGPEVIRQAHAMLVRIGEIYRRTFVFTHADAGGVAIDLYGEPLPAQALTLCKQSDAVLLGAVGGWQWDSLPGHLRPERALLGLRKALGVYANLRPAVLHPALRDACLLRRDIAEQGIDLMVVRELTGGMYFGEHGRKQTPDGTAAWDVEIYHENEIRRVAVAAFDIARKRRKQVTSVDKANVLESSRLWREVVEDVARDYPDTTLNHLYADNAAMQLVREPKQFDVLLTANMFGDILSDEASQLTGSVGMLPSACLGSGRPFIFEPVHGSAPDLAGQDKANPIATVLSAAMMLRYAFNLCEEADAVERAVAAVLDAGYRTGDIMSQGKKQIGTQKMGELITQHL